MKNLNASAKNQKSNLNEINLSKFANQLSSIQLKEKKERENIYIYPDYLSKEDIKGEKGKKFRNSIRNKRDRILNNILLYAKMKDSEKLKEESNSWMQFYSSNYRIQDFKIESLSNSKDDEKNQNMNLALQILSSICIKENKKNAKKSSIPGKKKSAKKIAEIKEEIKESI